MFKLQFAMFNSPCCLQISSKLDLINVLAQLKTQNVQSTIYRYRYKALTKRYVIYSALQPTNVEEEKPHVVGASDKEYM